MVVINGAIYLVSLMPKFIVVLLRVIYSKRFKNFCTERISCDLISEEADFFILISMISNFYIFYRFNKKFRESFKNLLGKLILKIRKINFY